MTFPLSLRPFIFEPHCKLLRAKEAQQQQQLLVHVGPRPRALGAHSSLVGLGVVSEARMTRGYNWGFLPEHKNNLRKNHNKKRGTPWNMCVNRGRGPSLEPGGGWNFLLLSLSLSPSSFQNEKPLPRADLEKQRGREHCAPTWRPTEQSRDGFVPRDDEMTGIKLKQKSTHSP